MCHFKKFKFANYYFDRKTLTAFFSYLTPDDIKCVEKVKFPTAAAEYDSEILNRALFLCFIIIGTSYYKADPTKKVFLPFEIDEFQADFFNHIYQEGLSQYAFENRLSRKNLAHFKPSKNPSKTEAKLPVYRGEGILSLQSGGKDSLLTATILKEQKLDFTPWYISASTTHPAVLDQLGQPLLVAERSIDLAALKNAKKNGHVPVTYINQALALVQAILLNKNQILVSIGHEGAEPHAHIGDLPVNHQWSKTWEAEQLFAKYVKKYVSSEIRVFSPLRQYSELKIAELFAEKCWKKYSASFSSCNVANYRQNHKNSSLKWCGNCAKCANTFLLFAPFVEPKSLKSLFGGEDLFAKSELAETFKGLLGIDGVMKPFECIGEIQELRQAYAMKKSGYADLPFKVPKPKATYDYQKLYPSQNEKVKP